MSNVSLGAILDKLEPVIASFGEGRASAPDLFEILTYGSAEQVNSNILVFYLDPHAYHGFGDLFL